MDFSFHYDYSLSLYLVHSSWFVLQIFLLPEAFFLEGSVTPWNINASLLAYVLSLFGTQTGCWYLLNILIRKCLLYIFAMIAKMHLFEMIRYE